MPRRADSGPRAVPRGLSSGCGRPRNRRTSEPRRALGGRAPTVVSVGGAAGAVGGRRRGQGGGRRWCRGPPAVLLPRAEEALPPGECRPCPHLAEGSGAPDGIVGAVVGTGCQGRRAGPNRGRWDPPAADSTAGAAGRPVPAGGLERAASATCVRRSGVSGSGNPRRVGPRPNGSALRGGTPEVMPLSRPRSASIGVKLLLGMTQPPLAPLMNLG